MTAVVVLIVCSENEAGWESDIRDDVLEECSKFGSVFHIHVDKFSQGNVFVKCSSPQVASSAFNNLNGRFFAGLCYPTSSDHKIHCDYIHNSVFLLREKDSGAVHTRGSLPHQIPGRGSCPSSSATHFLAVSSAHNFLCTACCFADYCLIVLNWFNVECVLYSMHFAGNYVYKIKYNKHTFFVTITTIIIYIKI